MSFGGNERMKEWKGRSFESEREMEEMKEGSEKMASRESELFPAQREKKTGMMLALGQ